MMVGFHDRARTAGNASAWFDLRSPPHVCREHRCHQMRGRPSRTRSGSYATLAAGMTDGAGRGRGGDVPPAGMVIPARRTRRAHAHHPRGRNAETAARCRHRRHDGDRHWHRCVSLSLFLSRLARCTRGRVSLWCTVTPSVVSSWGRRCRRAPSVYARAIVMLSRIAPVPLAVHFAPRPPSPATFCFEMSK